MGGPPNQMSLCPCMLKRPGQFFVGKMYKVPMYLQDLSHICLRVLSRLTRLVPFHRRPDNPMPPLLATSRALTMEVFQAILSMA